MLTIYNAAASAVAFATSILLGGASSNPSPEQCKHSYLTRIYTKATYTSRHLSWSKY
jgi:hypothetical protein